MPVPNTVLPSILFNVNVSAAANDPVNPLTRIAVCPAPFNPVDPSTAYNPFDAKYVKLLSHSIRVPFVIVSPSTPGVINVTAWNKHPASLLVA